jgi:UMF1 family MFS transporter
MFGLYALSGRVTSFVGPWLLGILTLVSGSQRVGMSTVLVFFTLGAFLMLPVKVKDSIKNVQPV